MSDSAFIDALSDDRTRWLNGDHDAWATYSASCLRLEAEVRSAQSAPAAKKSCSCCCDSCPSDKASRAPSADAD